MTLLFIGICAWLLLAVFVCSLGCAAKAGDETESSRAEGAARLPSVDVRRGGGAG